MNKPAVDYQKLLNGILEGLEDNVPSLLLHSCCAPCSTYCLEYLSQYFNITVFYYNPNIDTDTEYAKRAAEQRRLIALMPTKHPISTVVWEYEPCKYYEKVAGTENEKEGGARCAKCFDLRLSAAASYAKDRGFDYFASTLTVSPHKNARLINEIGQENAKIFEVEWLPNDFKKRNGFKRGTVLSKEYELYRQDYCGCIFSKNQEKLN